MNKNRILKFRVWDNNVKEFVEPCTDERMLFWYNSDQPEWKIGSLQENLVISQFIGQLDKNNREIYEGDILRFYVSNYEGAFNRELQGRVEYNSILGRYNVIVLESYKDGCYDMNECCEKEVIGNIYDKI